MSPAPLLEGLPVRCVVASSFCSHCSLSPSSASPPRLLRTTRNRRAAPAIQPAGDLDPSRVSLASRPTATVVRRPRLVSARASSSLRSAYTTGHLLLLPQQPLHGQLLRDLHLLDARWGLFFPSCGRQEPATRDVKDAFVVSFAKCRRPQILGHAKSHLKMFHFIRCGFRQVPRCSDPSDTSSLTTLWDEECQVPLRKRTCTTTSGGIGSVKYEDL